MVFKLIKYIVAIATSLSLCSCGDAFEQMFMNVFPYIAGGTVRPHDTYLATWEIENKTSRPIEIMVERRELMHGEWIYEGSYLYDLPIGQAIPINYTSSYANEKEFESKQNTQPTHIDDRVLLYDRESRELIFMMDYDFLATPGLWTARWQEDPVPGDYLYQRSLFKEKPEWVDDDKYTFIYWTFTLTDEHLAEYAAGKNQ